jgi:hypothetical protein
VNHRVGVLDPTGIAMPNYLNLYTPKDNAIVFIDHQPQMTFGVANIVRTGASAAARPHRWVQSHSGISGFSVPRT